MRDHARARKHSLNDDIKRNAQAAARALKKNFWGYVNHLLGENPAVTKATFTADQATTYFQDVFSKPSSKSFEAPEWLPTPKCAETLFATCSFTMDEIASRIKRGRLSHPSHAHSIRCHTTFSKGVHHCFQPSNTSTIKSGTPGSSQHPGNMQR